MKWRVRISLEASAQNPSFHRNCPPEAALGEVATGRGHSHWLSIFLLLLHSQWVEYFYTSGIGDNPHTDGLSLFYFRNTETQHVFKVLWHDLALDWCSALQACLFSSTLRHDPQNLRAQSRASGQRRQWVVGSWGWCQEPPSISVDPCPPCLRDITRRLWRHSLQYVLSKQLSGHLHEGRAPSFLT